ncbi:MAG: bacteriohemerythrin [Bacteroidales bacterium]
MKKNKKNNSALVSWNDCFKINVPEIDEQHKRFLDLVDDAQMKLDSSEFSDFNSIIKALEDYASYHFTFEEEVFEKSNFPNLTQHKQEHKQFIDKVRQLRLDLEYTNPLVAKKTIDFMRKWLISHIIKNDRKYLDYIISIPVSTDTT